MLILKSKFESAFRTLVVPMDLLNKTKNWIEIVRKVNKLLYLMVIKLMSWQILVIETY